MSHQFEVDRVELCVCGHADVDRFIALYKQNGRPFDGVVSVIGSNNDYDLPQLPDNLSSRHFIFTCPDTRDVVDLTIDEKSKIRSDINRMIASSRRLSQANTGGLRQLIHCNMGERRSPAVALTLWAALHPGWTPEAGVAFLADLSLKKSQESVNPFNRTSTSVDPHSGIIAEADKVLRLKGALIDVVEQWHLSRPRGIKVGQRLPTPQGAR